MSYAARQDLIVRFGEKELLGAAGTGAADARVIDETKIAEALADADRIIDGYVGRRYATPVDPVPPLLTTLACDLARFRLRNRNEGNGNVSDIVRDRHKDAIKILEGIASGAQTLPGARTAGGKTSSRVSGRAAHPVFAHGGSGLNGFMP